MPNIVQTCPLPDLSISLTDWLSGRWIDIIAPHCLRCVGCEFTDGTRNKTRIIYENGLILDFSYWSLVPGRFTVLVPNNPLSSVSALHLTPLGVKACMGIAVNSNRPNLVEHRAV